MTKTAMTPFCEGFLKACQARRFTEAETLEAVHAASHRWSFRRRLSSTGRETEETIATWLVPTGA